MKKISILVFLLMILSGQSMSQEIGFGAYYDGSILSTTVLKDLDFGDLIAGDLKQRELGSGDEGVIEITSLPFLDVLVTITPIQYITLDGDPCAVPSCRIEVAISYAYTNTGIADFAPGYELVAVPFISNVARFQTVRRQSGPPGPPPTPVHTGLVQPPLANAYIYVYGVLVDTDNSNEGEYSGTIVITIEGI